MENLYDFVMIKTEKNRNYEEYGDYISKKFKGIKRKLNCTLK
jgi:hypothetical protein